MSQSEPYESTRGVGVQTTGAVSANDAHSGPEAIPNQSYSAVEL
ncbi:hypothetical protein [Pseudomonas syringae group genomosp. 3]|nr:hypothetical protein [Pseudomonas syringae group genomosp. 3]